MGAGKPVLNVGQKFFALVLIVIFVMFVGVKDVPSDNYQTCKNLVIEENTTTKKIILEWEGELTMKHVRDFIETTKPFALQVERVYSIPFGVCIAQAALETGWGRFVKGNNYFGIKGEGQDLLTHEFINGRKVYIVDEFRAYSSMEDSFNDYGHFLTTNRRYQTAFETTDPEQFAIELQKAGYATDPEYADKLISIIRRWDLS